MAKITYAPLEELIVHDTLELSKDDLFRERITPQGNLPLFWNNGILYHFQSLPMNDDITKEYLKGRIHWSDVHFTRMDAYQPTMTLESEEYKSTMTLRVLNTSNIALHSDVIKWLKSRK